MGMIPAGEVAVEAVEACPHTHGDDPYAEYIADIRGLLVPTRMGMILINHLFGYFFRPCPHTHGDDPSKRHCIIFNARLSPHAWG